MRLATLATGGIGGFLAVKLAQSGHKVATIARGAHLASIAENGLTLDSPSGVECVHPWIATDNPSEVGEVDAIIFGVKGDALDTAARACMPMLGADTVVVPFLNGVEASDRLAEILPEHNVANGMAQVSTTIASPGVIKQTGEFNVFTFAERDSRPSERIDALRNAINGAGSSAPPTDDIKRDVWSKFVLFSAVSGVTAASRCTMNDIKTIPQLSELFRRVVSETASIGRVLGVSLPDNIEDKIWLAALALPPKMRASTAIDLENGRPLKIEWISGAAARISKKARIEAPINSALYALLLPHKNGR
ncbi:ketopantoate reductase family protein [Pseudohalocynthiibacter aestuariivivens]|jgi:2-dehydropantoate 2-reductase|uniref:2-dehydropantoate 2-reductase n=1 Tax=Pseudohalocynthiibacter aestuariivivens TaxID=1591409 RepID=A0ABV5JHR7_9RHOB|nr:MULTISPECIES: 2-dehydropantoate 2-reductase [Pseudohalocynthiibacter]MBS9718935.1 2-dehydropantoate 2-reductase [Pseudohalocynthiibacter aestuariivivens]MCK0104372.1 2-dehydropantoate 2-reductase [Pseudohalocynthiibacter sp. F2068]